MREGRSGALATLMAGTGDPYCSLVNVATAADGSPLLLISRLAVHTKNILADARVSLMLDERKRRRSAAGRARHADGPAAQTESADARRRYLARQPEAEMFAGFADFAFYGSTITGAHLVAGFGRIVDLEAAGACLTDLAGAEELVAAEAGRDRAHERRITPIPAGSTPPSCSARRTATGAAPAAIRKGWNCRTNAPGCGCRFRSASRSPACCARCSSSSRIRRERCDARVRRSPGHFSQKPTRSHTHMLAS